MIKTEKNQLTNAEIVKVFGLYPLCPVAIFDSQSDPKAAVPDYNQGGNYVAGMVITEHTYFDPQQVKLILKPVHHMTSDEIVRACRCYDNLGFMMIAGKNITLKEGHTPGIKKISIDGTPYSYRLDIDTGNIVMFKDGQTTWSRDRAGHLTQFYFHNNIAIPLYFDYGHWANGKTAIELGIAIPDRTLLNDSLNKKYDGDKTEIGNWWLENEKLDINNLAVMDEVIKNLLQNEK